MPGNTPELRRAVSRWQIVALSINDVVGSGIYLLPAAAALLLGPASIWAVALAGLLVGLLVTCYAAASSYYDAPGGGYLYTRDAFGDFIGFEVGWMTLLTRVSVAAALANGLAQALGHLWPGATDGVGRVLVVTGSLGLLTLINVVGVRAAATTSALFTITKLLPLAVFVLVGIWFIDADLLQGSVPVSMEGLAEAALLLLFAYVGFENTPAAAGEYRNPQKDVPFALATMIVTVTLVYVLVLVVAMGTLPGIATSATPLASAAEGFLGSGGALLLTVGAVVSILGTNSNTLLFGPRYLYALAQDGYGPAVLGRVHPRFRTPAVAVVSLGVVSLLLALSGTFVALALLSVVARLFTYVGTAGAVIRLQRRYPSHPTALRLPGGPVIPLAAIALSLLLLAAAGWANLLAGAVALLVGAAIFRLRRPPADA